MPRPDIAEYAGYFSKYIDLVPEADILSVLTMQLDETLTFLRAIPESQCNVLHPPYTWTVKDVVGHLIDGERVFGYRALRFARGDSTPLAGFDENEYARTAEYARLAMPDVVNEYEAVRRSNLLMFRNLPAAAWDRAGKANDNHLSVRALAYILVGHTRHHGAILRKRLSAA
jgi:hypothetical protein